MPTTDREPLCPIAVLPFSPCALGTDQPELPGLHSSYWLMRQTIILMPTSVIPISAGPCRLLRAPAGRWSFPTLSLRSLYRCLDPYPVTALRCSCPFLPGSHRPHLTCKKFRPMKNILLTALRRKISRGCNHSFIFRLPYLLDPLAVLTSSFLLAIGPYTPRSTCSVTGYKLRHRYVSESGQLTRQDLGRLPPPHTCWIAALSAAPTRIPLRIAPDFPAISADDSGRRER